MDVRNFFWTFFGNLNSFDHVPFQLLYVLEMNQIRFVLGLISFNFCFPLCNKDLNKHLTYHSGTSKLSQVSVQVMLTIGPLWVNLFSCS